MAPEDSFIGTDAPRGAKPSRAPWVLLLLVLAATAAIVYLGFQLLRSERIASASAQKAADEAMAAKRATDTKLDSLAEENARLASERDILARQVQEKDTELSKLKATYDSLEDKLKTEIKKGDIRLSQAGGRIQVDLVDKILFDSGQAELSHPGEEVLSRVGSILAHVEDKQIQVSGHTDDSPIADPKLKDKFPTNWELSSARAINVVRYLAEKAQVPPRRLVAAGYGQFHPIATNANGPGRARNRRIEILLTPALDAKSGEGAKPAATKPAAAPVPAAKASAATPAKPPPPAKKSAKR
jgi:chemotaxis protein MotB